MNPMDVYRMRRICRAHFTDECFLVGSRRLLKKSAIPNRNLPDPGSEESESSEKSLDMSTSSSERKLSSVGVSSSDMPSSQDSNVSSNPSGQAERIDSPTGSRILPVDQGGQLDLSTYGISDHPSQEISGDISQPLLSTSGPFYGDLAWPLTDSIGSSELEMQPGPSTEFSGALQGESATSLQKRAKPLSTGRKIILKQFGVRRAVDLTPKAKFLLKETQILRKKMCRTSSKLFSTKRRLQLAERSLRSGLGQDFNNLPATVSSFLKCQLRESKKNLRGRRFTLEDKVLALSLMKRSGRSYRFLAKYFVLPSRRTLLRLLSNLSFKAGINDDMFAHLSVVVDKQVTDSDRHAILMFDEMSLSAHLDYNGTHDMIEGFEDLGGGRRSNDFADKALVFMIRGLRRSYKQPVAFVFPSTSVKSADLASLIREVGSKVMSTGLTIDATVCDQGASNVAAINRMCAEAKESMLRKGEEYRGEYFEIDNFQVIPLFDPPHLLKGIRNGLLEKDLRFTREGSVRKASWQHIQQFYALDTRYSHRMVQKLTDSHVIPHKIRKMKVSCCSQVFSHTVGSLMYIMADICNCAAGSNLDANAKDTAKFLLFMDELFDSVNGSSVRPSKGKNLLCALQRSSGHIAFWNEAVQVLESMVYVAKDGKETRTPSMNNWARTLRNIKALWFRLINKGFKFLSLRNLNQDPLENKFGAIRSYGFRNNAPSCSNFIGAYKSLLLASMMSSRSVGQNCEEDDCTVLDNLKEYLVQDNTSQADIVHQNFVIGPDSIEEEDPDEPGDVDNVPASSQMIERLVSTYTAGYMLKKVCNECEQCIAKQHTSSTHDEHAFILERERASGERLLTYPTRQYVDVYSNCRDMVVLLLPLNCHKIGVGHFLRTQLLSIDFSSITCEDHREDYKSKFIKLLVKMLIHSWCESVNRFLSGRDTRVIPGMDSIHKKAFEYCLKHRRRH